MAKPVAASVQLPSDAGNAGKLVRTQTQVIGGNTVHTHFFVPVTQRTIDGVYFADGGAVSTISALATNGTTAGFYWGFNPSGATTNMRLRRIKVEHQITATTVFVTNPRVALALTTFTGTPSGAALTVAKRASADAAAQSSIRTASTGATVTLGNIAHSTIPAVVTTVTPGAVVAGDIELLVTLDAMADEDGKLTMATGEGFVLYQPDAGTTSDTRKFDTDFVWEEDDNS